MAPPDPSQHDAGGLEEHGIDIEQARLGMEQELVEAEMEAQAEREYWTTWDDFHADQYRGDWYGDAADTDVSEEAESEEEQSVRRASEEPAFIGLELGTGKPVVLPYKDRLRGLTVIG